MIDFTNLPSKDKIYYQDDATVMQLEIPKEETKQGNFDSLNVKGIE